MSQALGRTLDGWETEILRPIIVAVGTAFVLFLFSLMFAPVRGFLFGELAPYPLYCTAEALSAPDGSRLIVEFLIVNVTDQRLTRADLEKQIPRDDSTLARRSPDIVLRYQPKRGEVLGSHADEPFNEQKGTIRTVHEPRSVTIAVDDIQPRAVLRAIIETSVVDGSVRVLRAAKGAVPFNVADYEAACYSR